MFVSGFWRPSIFLIVGTTQSIVIFRISKILVIHHERLLGGYVMPLLRSHTGRKIKDKG